MASSKEFHKELEQIQKIIDRQASNSFKIKGWTIGLVVAALVFRGEDYQMLIGFIPLIGFWYLDAFYLRQERLFRELYDWVRENRPDNKDHLFNMDVSRFDDKVSSTICLMFARSTIRFYGMLAIFITVYSIVVFYINDMFILTYVI